MTECATKKIGRPRAEHTLPLIFAQDRPRVLREFTLEAHTSQLLEDYAEWAAATGGISMEEARVLLIGRSVDAFVKRDHLFIHFFQDQKRKEAK